MPSPFPEFIAAVKADMIARSTLRKLPQAMKPEGRAYSHDAPHALWLCGELESTRDRFEQGILIGQIIFIMVARGSVRSEEEWRNLVRPDRRKRILKGRRGSS